MNIEAIDTGEELAPGFRLRRDPATGSDYLEVARTGEALNDFPMFNKGTAFTAEEREALGLRGLLPPRVTRMEQQVERVMENYARKTTDLERYIHLISLMDRNETLFYRVLSERLEEMLPIVYTPTVGLACRKFGHIYRRNRGLYLTPEDTDRVDEILGHWPFRDARVIVVTDGQRILGLGDLGAGGMGISIGKTSLYVAGAGLHPARVLPVCLDVGTDTAALREDPLYLGTDRPRLKGAPYDALVDAFVRAAARRWPKALIQFEDFGIDNAFRLLDRHRTGARCFNDDIQGTGAVVRAGLLSALRRTGRRLDRERVFIVGAGSAGIGIARMVSDAPTWCFDSKGLLTEDRGALRDFQRSHARRESPGSPLEVARRVHPTILIGVTGRAGVFTRELIQSMDGPEPIVFPLSNPGANAEATPSQVREWSGGRARIATGSPFPGTAQCNNLYVFPGLGLGVLAAGATRVTDGMFHAAARSLSEQASPGELFPPLRDIRRISLDIALAVGIEACSTGAAPPCDAGGLRSRIRALLWEPRYVSYRPAP